ncbi:MAG: hypothetical protein IJ228_01765 [Succinivibrio sp.]|nr:hypothetical protein [Succinivibrio sp.]
MSLIEAACKRQKQKQNRSDLQKFETAAIYRDLLHLLRVLQSVNARMNRSYKYSAGERLVDEGYKAVNKFAVAYQTKDPDTKLKRARKVVKHTQYVLIQLRVLDSMQLVSRNAYKECIECCVKIVTQGKAWIKHLSPRPESDCKDPAASEQGEHSECAMISDVRPNEGKGSQEQ